jgi:hypothetical protein
MVIRYIGKKDIKKLVDNVLIGYKHFKHVS